MTNPELCTNPNCETAPYSPHERLPECPELKQTWRTAPVGITCSACGSNSGYPITYDWWLKHVDPLHRFKYWLKRRFK